MTDAAPRFATLRRIPKSVWALGLVSLLMDFSSEMIHALLPVYLVGAMGATMAEVGVIEGIAEATASIVKIFSGAISDWFGARKLLYAINSKTVPKGHTTMEPSLVIRESTGKPGSNARKTSRTDR